MGWRFGAVGGYGGWGGLSVCVGVIAIAPVPIRKRGGLNEKPPARVAALSRERPITLIMLKLISNVFNALAFLAAKMAAKHKMLCLRRSPNSCDCNHFLARARTRRRVCLGVRFGPQSS